MSEEYKKYYQDQLDVASKFQDFVAIVLHKELGITLMNFGSKDYQYQVGENMQGIEIKYDKMFEDTGNLWLEVQEKSNPNNKNYARSGIFRVDNSWLYLIGNYSKLFLFGKSSLQKILLSKQNEVIENNTGTSKGYLMNSQEAEYFAEKVIDASKYSKKLK